MSENEQDPGPAFQAFTVKTTSRAAQQKVDHAISDVLGDGWHAKNYGDRPTLADKLGGRQRHRVAELCAVAM